MLMPFFFFNSSKRAGCSLAFIREQGLTAELAQSVITLHLTWVIVCWVANRWADHCFCHVCPKVNGRIAMTRFLGQPGCYLVCFRSYPPPPPSSPALLKHMNGVMKSLKWFESLLANGSGDKMINMLRHDRSGMSSHTYQCYQASRAFQQLPPCRKYGHHHLWY